MKKDPLTKGLTRHKAVYAVVRVCFGWIFRWKFSFSYEPYKPKSEVFLFLGNHTTVFDQFFQVIHLKRHMRYVASANLLQGGFGRILAFFTGPIPRVKGASADDTVRLIAQNLRAGVSVAMHPEGKRTCDGKTGYISPRTASILKMADCGLITWRSEGAFLARPRFGKYKRRGRIFGHVIREYTKEELAQMSVEEIHAAICRDLYTDAYAYQREHMHPYKGKKKAEGIESVLYLCPQCHSFQKIRGEGDRVYCQVCDCRAEIDDYGFFQNRNALSFDSLSAWCDFQKQYLIAHAEEWIAQRDTPIWEEQDVALYKKEDKAPLSSSGVLQIYGDRLVFVGQETYTFPMQEISSFGGFGKSKLMFTANGTHYMLYAKDRLTEYPYFALWRVLNRKPLY